MKNISINHLFRLGGICFILALSGCISIPNSPTPRFYALTPINQEQIEKTISSTPGLIIGIGPVKVPEYMDRPQMVTLNKERMVQIAQFDRWGEALDLGLARLLRENMTVMLPSVKLTLYPWNPSMLVKYQVVAEIIQLDCEIDGEMHFVVQWMIIDVQSSKILIIKRSEFRTSITPHNYSGLANTLSADMGSLSRQITDGLVSLR